MYIQLTMIDRYSNAQMVKSSNPIFLIHATTDLRPKSSVSLKMHIIKYLHAVTTLKPSTARQSCKTVVDSSSRVRRARRRGSCRFYHLHEEETRNRECMNDTVVREILESPCLQNLLSVKQKQFYFLLTNPEYDASTSTVAPLGHSRELIFNASDSLAVVMRNLSNNVLRGSSFFEIFGLSFINQAENNDF